MTIIFMLISAAAGAVSGVFLSFIFIPTHVKRWKKLYSRGRVQKLLKAVCPTYIQNAIEDRLQRMWTAEDLEYHLGYEAETGLEEAQQRAGALVSDLLGSESVPEAALREMNELMSDDDQPLLETDVPEDDLLETEEETAKNVTSDNDQAVLGHAVQTLMEWAGVEAENLFESCVQIDALNNLCYGSYKREERFHPRVKEVVGMTLLRISRMVEHPSNAKPGEKRALNRTLCELEDLFKVDKTMLIDRGDLTEFEVRSLRDGTAHRSTFRNYLHALGDIADPEGVEEDQEKLERQIEWERMDARQEAEESSKNAYDDMAVAGSPTGLQDEVDELGWKMAKIVRKYGEKEGGSSL